MAVPGLLQISLLMMLASPFAAGQVAGGTTPDGAMIFAERCAVCHGKSGEGIAAAVTIAGPSLQAEHDVGRVMTTVVRGRAICRPSQECFPLRKFELYPSMFPPKLR